MCRRLAALVFVVLVLAPQSALTNPSFHPTEGPETPTFNFYWGRESRTTTRI